MMIQFRLNGKGFAFTSAPLLSRQRIHPMILILFLSMIWLLVVLILLLIHPIQVRWCFHHYYIKGQLLIWMILCPFVADNFEWGGLILPFIVVIFEQGGLCYNVCYFYLICLRFITNNKFYTFEQWSRFEQQSSILLLVFQTVFLQKLYIDFCCYFQTERDLL